MSNIQLKVTNFQKHIRQTPNVSRQFSPEEKTRLAKASKDFESLLTAMMLKSMNKTTNGLFGENSYGGDILDTVFEQEIAKHITEDKGLGIAEQIYRQITGEEFKMQDYIRLKSPGNKNLLLNKTDEKIPSVKPNINSMKRLEKYHPIIKSAAKKYGVNENIIKSIIMTESAANENAISKAKAKGLMQLMDSTAHEMGVKNIWDPNENIHGGTKYFANLLRQYDGDLDLSLAAYNAGPANVERYNGVPPFNETKNYIARVTSYLKSMEN